jgi:CRP-like cAMP-binding protein
VIFERRERVVRRGEEAASLFIVESGRVAASLGTPDGENLTLSVLGPGDVFGEVGTFGGRQVRTATVVALGPVAARVVRRDVLDALREHHPEINEFLLQLMAQRIDRLSHLLAEAYYLPVRRRVARRLYEIARLYAATGEAAVLPLTQDEVAQIAGATRPTANQALRRLEDMGILSLSRGSIVVADLAALRVQCTWS